ncbi:dihydrofolate reductase [Bdellovibrionota bacterium FG-2]
MKISLIVAMAENRCIGREGRIPWRFSEDLKRFRKITMGHSIVMGRKTFESLGRPLPGRKNVVLSRLPRPGGVAAEVVWVSALEEALAQAGDEVFVIGGAEIYALALPKAERIYLTQLHTDIQGDVFFPELLGNEWRKIQDHPTQTEEGIIASYQLFERIGS